MAKKQTWIIGSGDIKEVVRAMDQFEAWDTLRDRPAEDFGLIASAEPNESSDPFHVRTSLLMYRWGRDADAKRFIERGIECGMPDTTDADMKAGRKQ